MPYVLRPFFPAETVSTSGGVAEVVIASDELPVVSLHDTHWAKQSPAAVHDIDGLNDRFLRAEEMS